MIERYFMKHFVLASTLVLFAMVSSLCAFESGDFKSGIPWKAPKVVTPGESFVTAPSDATVLFDGTNLDAFQPSKWVVADGAVTVEPGTGDLETKEAFGSVQLHVEFATPPLNLDEQGNPVDFGQARGNSGIFLMNHYEVQVLDSFNSETYFDGQCASIYKQFPPEVNVCKAPGEWQTYDIYFNRPILRIEENENGEKEVVEVIRPAYVTVVQNGVLVINHWEIKGDTWFVRSPNYMPHADKEPIRFQDHGNRMKYRNIWIREIKDSNVVPAQSEIQHYNH